jgi:hypothetical protein
MNIVEGLESIVEFIQTNAVITGLLLLAVFLFTGWLELRHDLRARREDRRQQFQADVERRRLSERNLDVQASADLFHRHVGSPDGKHIGEPVNPFVVAQLELKNIGDGPIDLLACMVAGRELTDDKFPLATQARDVAWDDLLHFFWDENDPVDDTGQVPLFRGISTTKNITYSPDQLVRLDPRQREELIRIDAVINLPRLYEQGHMNIEYKIFTVALGYPLAALRGPNKYDAADQRSRLYSLELARPDYSRWAHVERALDTINRYTFRLALEELEVEVKANTKPEATPPNYYVRDPLGRLADATAWRCFLLHHWDFDERGDAVPLGTPNLAAPLQLALKNMKSIDTVKEEIGSKYHIYDPNTQQAPDYSQRLAGARRDCRQALDPLVKAWIALNETIDRCNAIGYGFKQLITKDPEHKARWEALQAEDYLLSDVREEKISPHDPLAVERYAIRTKYVLVTLKAPGHEKMDRATPTG